MSEAYELPLKDQRVGRSKTKEMYITYDLWDSRQEELALNPKVKKVIIGGDLVGWDMGKIYRGKAYGVRVYYEQIRKRFVHSVGSATHQNDPSTDGTKMVRQSKDTVSKEIEVPRKAVNVQFREGPLPDRYRAVLDAS